MGGNRGRGRGRKKPAAKAGNESDDESREEHVVHRGRGRAKPKSCDLDNAYANWIIKGKKGVPDAVIKRLEKSLRAEENDSDIVTCSKCLDCPQLTYRKFKLHNIQYHMNSAITNQEKEEKDLSYMDHKYFARKLNEFKRLTNATTFECPRLECTSKFKSTLGLAYHMNTCGRTQEELDAVLIECEICHGKFSLPNLPWHKKSHEAKSMVDTSVGADGLKQITRSGKRGSSHLLRKRDGDSKKNAKSTEGDDEDDSLDESTSDEESSVFNSSASRKSNARNRSRGELDCNDYCNLSLNFLENINSEGKAWDDPVRNHKDSFLHMLDNKFKGELSTKEQIESYLPVHRKSVEFKCVTGDDNSSYHRLAWFEGEAISLDSNPSTPKSSLCHTGGPVLSMSWHPCGQLLAVSTGKDLEEEIDSLEFKKRKGCIQIYSCSSDNLIQLQLIIGLKWGYATHIQWSSFYPDIMDSYSPNENFADVDVYCRIGYLAVACEDSTIRIMAVRIEDFRLPPNYEYKEGHRVKVYVKTPEICLKIHESAVEDDTGNVTKFDWHEDHRYLAAGYTDGTIAVYDLETESSLLTATETDGPDRITVINPFWTFSGHRLPVKGLCFDPKNSRYLVSAGQDRCLKVWDVETRMLRETKRTGMCLDMCWIRGWMHQALSCESHIAYQSSMHNYVRVFPVGSSGGRPTSADYFNFTSLDFYHGLIVHGTDDGKASVTYYDWFWRECDFDRNRKKKNLVILSTLQVDSDSYTKVSSSDFVVNVKKLQTEVYSSKAFQRLGVDEEKGVYSVMLEAKFGGSQIFKPLPSTLDDDIALEEENNTELGPFGVMQNIISNNDAQSQSEAPISTNDENNESAIVNSDELSVIYEPKKKDGLIPVCDVDIRDEEPKVVFSFVKQRPNTTVPVTNLEIQKMEEYVRFQPYVRINKVSWSPTGQVIAVGYRNGLISLLPGGFETLFSSKP